MNFRMNSNRFLVEQALLQSLVPGKCGTKYLFDDKLAYLWLVKVIKASHFEVCAFLSN